MLGGHRHWLGWVPAQVEFLLSPGAFKLLRPCDRLPNSAQNCYMTASLQSLITIKDIIKDIRRTEELWRSVPEAEVVRYSRHTSFRRQCQQTHNSPSSSSSCRRLMDIVNVHSSTDYIYKLNALTLFKQTVSLEAPEFCDDMQKVSFLVWWLPLRIDVGIIFLNLPLCSGCSWVPDHRSLPDTEIVSASGANCCQQGKKIHLSCWKTPSVQDADHQDLQEVSELCLMS